MADWHPGFDMTGVSISDPDAKAGSPKPGDKIARNPKNHDDRWLVAEDYFADSFEPMDDDPRPDYSKGRVDPERLAQIIAHRACTNEEHDPENGKLSGFCVVCGYPWPCQYAGPSPEEPVGEEPKPRYGKSGLTEDHPIIQNLRDQGLCGTLHMIDGTEHACLRDTPCPVHGQALDSEEK